MTVAIFEINKPGRSLVDRPGNLSAATVNLHLTSPEALLRRSRGLIRAWWRWKAPPPGSPGFRCAPCRIYRFTARFGFQSRRTWKADRGIPRPAGCGEADLSINRDVWCSRRHLHPVQPQDPPRGSRHCVNGARSRGSASEFRPGPEMERGRR